MKQDATYNEMLPVVDPDDQVVGEAKRGVVHQRGLKHRAAHVLVFDGQGRLYLQLRSAAKDTHPGKWTTSASGHLDPGESYEQAAARELREELGLACPLTYLGKLPAQPATDNEFAAVFWTRTGQPPAPAPQEISEGRFFTWEQALELARDLTASTPSLGVVLELAGRLGLGSARPESGATPARPRP
jgi:isopentenyl-diphosphate delta-isomerase type 1